MLFLCVHKLRKKRVLYLRGASRSISSLLRHCRDDKSPRRSWVSNRRSTISRSFALNTRTQQLTKQEKIQAHLHGIETDNWWRSNADSLVIDIAVTQQPIDFNDGLCKSHNLKR